MTRIVVDTNVLIAALRSPRGRNRDVLRACATGLALPLVGQKLYLEYEDVMSRDVLFKKCPLSRAEREELFDGFLSLCEWVAVSFLWRPNLPDEGDNHAVELAVAGDAAAIVTNNTRDFRGGELRFPGIKIQTPTQFLEEL